MSKTSSLWDCASLTIGGVAVTATPAELNVLHGVTPGTALASSVLVVGATKNVDTLVVTNLKTGATPTVCPDSCTIAPAAGSANVSLVTITVKDGSGTAMARATPITVWLSDASTGLGVTATTASGAVAAGASGTDIVDLTAKKVKKVVTSATGVYILSITDTSKTGFYVVVDIPDCSLQVSAQLVTGNYG